MLAKSHLLHGIVIWGHTYDNHLKRLIILRNKAVKIVAGGQRQDHVTPFYHRLQILKLKGLYVYRMKSQNKVAKAAKQTHGKSHRMAQIVTSFLFERTTRFASSELNWYFPRYRTQTSQKSFKYQEAKIWNSVPYELKKNYHLININ